MKRVVRKKALKLSPQAEQAFPVMGGVLLFMVLISVQPQKQQLHVKPIAMNVGQTSHLSSQPSWQGHKGWWGGYWWGSKPFVWHGRDWGLGRSTYPWFWEYDNLARGLNLSQLAKQRKWSTIEKVINNKISELRQEIEITQNKATKRKLERTIERLEYYFYNARLYKNTPPQRIPRYI
jgi:hypothetical protein